MIKLLLKIILLICLIVFSLTALFIGAPRDELSYYLATENKVKRLEQIQSPKIVLVGGSNLTFGIDCKRIEHEFNLPVVNMSLHAGLGLEFMLNQLKNRVKSGDIILISPEYSHFSKNNKGDSDAIFSFILNNKNKYCFDFSPYTLLYHVGSFGPTLFRQYVLARREITHGIYTKTNFDEYGDMIGHLKLEHEQLSNIIKNTSNNSDDSSIDYSQIERINNFSKSMACIEANTYILYPVISYTGYNYNKEFNAKTAGVMKSQLISKTLSVNSKYIFNDNLFFNTIYHLDNTGRNLRTDYVINDMHRVIFNTPPRL